MFTRQSLTLTLALCAGLLAGCTTLRQTARMERFKPFQGPTGPDVVQVDLFLVERAPADAYINIDLWSVADEQIIPLEQKAVLNENGFRVGQIGGMTPTGLQNLLMSEKSCPNPRRLQLRAGSDTTLIISPRADRVTFVLRPAAEPVPVELDGAECTIHLRPSLTDDGRVRIQFTPQVRHGEATVQPGPNAERTGWMLREQQPAERYAALGWEVILGASEFVVVGGRADRAQTLGHAFFVRPGEAVPVQRLLVLRATPFSGSTAAASSEKSAEKSLLSKSPPLVLQASLSGLRAN